MKVLLLACFLFLANVKDASSVNEVLTQETKASLEIADGYHQRIGIKEAERIRIGEDIRSRIAGGLSSYNGEHPYMVRF